MSSNPACARMRRQGFCRLVMLELGTLPAVTQGLSS